MRIVFAYSKKERAKVKVVGKILDLMALLIAISKCLAERISKEKGVYLEEAENLVVDCIKEGIKVMEEYK